MKRARDRLRSSIEWRLPVLVGTVLLLVTGAMASAAYIQVRRSAEWAAADRLSSAIAQLAAGLSGQLPAMKSRMRLLADDKEVLAFFRGTPADTGNAKRAEALAVLVRDTTVLGGELWDAQGNSVAATNPRLPMLVSPEVRRDLVTAANGPDTAAVGPFLLDGNVITYPLVAAVVVDGRHAGYVVSWSKNNRSKRVREQLAVLFGSDATLLVGSTPGAWTDQQDIVAAPRADLSRTGTILHYMRGRAGARIATAARVAGTPWTVALEFSESDVLALARAFLVRIVLIGLLVLAIGLVGAWLLSRYITLPLREMIAVVDARSAGATDARLDIKSVDELGRLATAFNHLADHVNEEVAIRRTSEAQWRLLFRNHPHPMWVFDTDTLAFLAVNDAAVAKYGYSTEEFLAMSVRDIRPPDEVEQAVRAFPSADAPASSAEVWHHQTKSGKVLDVQVDANSLTFDGRSARLVLAQDLTDQRALESHLRQAQRMEAVGRLAGGVAHDFNNVLTVILAVAQLMRESTPPAAPEIVELDAIIEAALRAAALTRQLLALSRQQLLLPEAVDPNEVVLQMRALLGRALGEDIDIHTDLADDSGTIIVDRGQLEQMLLNLAVNARDAMPSGGMLTITTAVVELDETGASLHGLSQVGRFVVISVADTGVGMTAEIRSKIFDPFFTTKDVGKGTGLGLATVYGFVTQSGGAVTVYSEPGIGSTFRIYLPRSDAPSELAPPPSPATSVPGSGNILLVEDEEQVRKTVTRVLQALGYTVLIAESGERAIAIAAEHGGSIELVVSDVVMPGMDGPTLISRLRQERPDLKALLLSGYSAEAVASRGFGGTSAMFLQKPFSISELSERVRDAIRGETTELG